mmetsp:Transcript_17387/g.43300  ORF Transcript_17387/g.43300 Transcript_17387/m.43300 type:complete len:250 (+) Transcript_17387:311-1060(+)
MLHHALPRFPSSIHQFLEGLDFLDEALALRSKVKWTVISYCYFYPRFSVVVFRLCSCLQCERAKKDLSENRIVLIQGRLLQGLDVIGIGAKHLLCTLVECGQPLFAAKIRHAEGQYVPIVGLLHSLVAVLTCKHAVTLLHHLPVVATLTGAGRVPRVALVVSHSGDVAAKREVVGLVHTEIFSGDLCNDLRWTGISLCLAGRHGLCLHIFSSLLVPCPQLVCIFNIRVDINVRASKRAQRPPAKVGYSD